MKPSTQYTQIFRGTKSVILTCIVANTTPQADLFLVNNSTSLATEIENLVEKRPHVIVCSLGFDQFNQQLSKAVNKAINAGIIPVFSAGNIGLTGSNTISYPPPPPPPPPPPAGLEMFSASEPTRGTVHLTASALWVVKSTS